MKLIGNYTCPYVRKISVVLLEKGIVFEFVNHIDSNGDTVAGRYNPLGDVPVLVMEDGESWFDSRVIAASLEQLNIAPSLVPREPLAALNAQRVEALADGIIRAAARLMQEQQRPAGQVSEQTLAAERERIRNGLDWLEAQVVARTVRAQPLDVGAIAVGCAIGYLNQHRLAPGWCVNRPQLVRLAEALFRRESFARTEPPAT
ncbi:glutathione S-transferase [Entomohabitans teleogrylli]|uniref:glutathione S-transferase n=1 Tax=Entomohabitans teleogrylli TaxID=1384589 RepID=UPI00073D6FE5|nr:glutathione S-transferase [Entomohabitans teleogrylli]